MLKIDMIKFVYYIANNTCYIQVGGQPLRELTIKGSTDYQGEINGTWFQIDNLINHWISFRKDRFRLNTWEVFYKWVSNGEIKYYRRLFLGVKEILTFSFAEKDEWIKIDGKWKSKY